MNPIAVYYYYYIIIIIIKCSLGDAGFSDALSLHVLWSCIVSVVFDNALTVQTWLLSVPTSCCVNRYVVYRHFAGTAAVGIGHSCVTK
jgi:hypothetical protein